MVYSGGDSDDDLQMEQNPKLQRDVFNAAAIPRIPKLRQEAERKKQSSDQN